MPASTATDGATTNDRTKDEAPRFLPLTTMAVHLDGPGSSSRDPVFGIVANMSRTGACLITNRAVAKDTIVELSVTSGEDRVKLEARTVWSAEGMDSVKEIVGFLTGVSFTPRDDAKVEALLTNGNFQRIP